MATGDLHKKFCEDRSSGSRDTLADRQTHRQIDRQTNCNTPLPYRGGVITNWSPPVDNLAFISYHSYNIHISQKICVRQSMLCVTSRQCSPHNL